MNQERALYADTVRNTANPEHFPNARALSSDDDALKHLDTLTRTFDNLRMDTNRVAGAKIRNVRAELLLFQRFNDIHFCSSYFVTFVAESILSRGPPVHFVTIS